MRSRRNLSLTEKKVRSGEALNLSRVKIVIKIAIQIRHGNLFSYVSNFSLLPSILLTSFGLMKH